MQLDFNKFKNTENSEKAIIALHGWSGNKDSFLPFVKNSKFRNVEWFLPEAPYIVDGDSQKKSWTYKKGDGTWEIGEPITMMESFLNKIIFNRYESRDVYVIGFSQGAAVCYEYIIGIKKKLGGIFPIGGFLFKDSRKDKRVSDCNISTPILIGHGLNDKIIPIEKSRIAYNQLLEEGANVKFYQYNGGHKISMSYIKEVAKIINESK